LDGTETYRGVWWCRKHASAGQVAVTGDAETDAWLSSRSLISRGCYRENSCGACTRRFYQWEYSIPSKYPDQSTVYSYFLPEMKDSILGEHSYFPPTYTPTVGDRPSGKSAENASLEMVEKTKEIGQSPWGKQSSQEAGYTSISDIESIPMEWWINDRLSEPVAGKLL
jgi:hypothetical protein